MSRKERDEVKRAMQERGFAYDPQRGGGANAYTSPIGKTGEFVVTIADDAMAPESFSEPVAFGAYPAVNTYDGNQSGLVLYFPSLKSMLTSDVAVMRAWQKVDLFDADQLEEFKSNRALETFLMFSDLPFSATVELNESIRRGEALRTVVGRAGSIVIAFMLCRLRHTTTYVDAAPLGKSLSLLAGYSAS